MFMKSIIILFLVSQLFAFNVEQSDKKIKYEGIININHGLSRCFGNNEIEYNSIHLEINSLNKTDFMVMIFQNDRSFYNDLINSRKGFLSLNRDLDESFWGICVFSKHSNMLNLNLELNNYKDTSALFWIIVIPFTIILAFFRLYQLDKIL